ncbi:NodY [Bradyrhizobium genosp. SA-3]|uniref:NodY n=1 Tax=Bradyrhizobium genosp. SA-3 TaxID=508868 RepID=UPI001FDED055|nr:NodY [Bradyrhizobium genosp. SA-3]
MAAGRSRGLREKLLDVRAARRIRFEGGYGRAVRATSILLSAKLAQWDTRRIPINLGLRIPSVSILEVYSRTLERAFSLILVSRNSGRRRLRMPSISGESPNGSPVHRIQGVSKMHKNQFDLMPLRCAIDEAPRIDGLPSDVKTSTAMLDEAEKRRGADRFWLVQSLRRHLPAYRAQGIGRVTTRTMRSLHRERRREARCRRGVPSSDGAWQRHFSVDRRFGG